MLLSEQNSQTTEQGMMPSVQNSQTSEQGMLPSEQNSQTKEQGMLSSEQNNQTTDQKVLLPKSKLDTPTSQKGANKKQKGQETTKNLDTEMDAASDEEGKRRKKPSRK